MAVLPRLGAESVPDSFWDGIIMKRNESGRREYFNTRIGFVLAAVGSAVGLGNMWRFPYVAAEGGGAAFVTLYILLTLAVGIPLMLSEFSVAGFYLLGTLSTHNEDPPGASRPFDLKRDGFILGEGAAIVILESLSSAQRRGATILAELIGYGSSSDAYRVTDMHDEGRGAVQAMQAAMVDAGVTYKDVDYINTHGTSTAENDSVETLAIKTAFKERARQVPASSVKSMLGHLIGAAGGAELITCVLAIRDNVIPATANLHDPDPNLDLDYVPNAPRQAPLNIVMNESFGFGGQNNVVILKRFEQS